MNSEQFMDVIFGAIDKGKSPPQLFMATVGFLDTSTTPSGAKVYLKFDGTNSDSPYSFPVMDSAFPLTTNQRVLVARIGGTYLVIGKVMTYT